MNKPEWTQESKREYVAAALDYFKSLPEPEGRAKLERFMDGDEAVIAEVSNEYAKRQAADIARLN